MVKVTFKCFKGSSFWGLRLLPWPGDSVHVLHINAQIGSTRNLIDTPPDVSPKQIGRIILQASVQISLFISSGQGYTPPPVHELNYRPVIIETNGS